MYINKKDSGYYEEGTKRDHNVKLRVSNEEYKDIKMGLLTFNATQDLIRQKHIETLENKVLN
jgi:hypothetical protein